MTIKEATRSEHAQGVVAFDRATLKFISTPSYAPLKNLYFTGPLYVETLLIKG